MNQKTIKTLKCFGINLAIVCLAIFVFGTRLSIDDDNILSWMTYGIITRPSARTLYTNIILGGLYKRLFLLFPGFNWQTLIYYVFILFSGTAGLYAVLMKKNRILTILWVMFEVTFFYDVYVVLTFSMVAGYLACQGYLALFLLLREEKRSMFLYIASGLSLVISAMIRTGPFVSASGFAFVVWLVIVVSDYKNLHDIKSIAKNWIYPLALIFAVCFAVIVLDKAFYTKGEWKEYRDHENMGSIVTDEDNSANRGDFDLLEKVGVTKTQGLAVVEWRSNDPEILTTELLEKIVSTKDNYRYLTSPTVWETFWIQWKNIFSTYCEVYFSLIILVSIICFTKKFTPVLLLLPFMGEVFYLAYIGRVDDGIYPERCVYVIFMPLVIGAMILLASLKQTMETNSVVSWVALGVLTISVFVAQIGKDFSINGLGLVDTDEICEEYRYLGNGNKIYVCEYDVRTEVEEAFGAWQVPEAGFMDQTIVIGSWTIDHPMQNELQASLGCENPYRALFENDNVYYIEKSGSHDAVLSYLQENYDERIDIEYIKEKGNFKVFKYSIE